MTQQLKFREVALMNAQHAERLAAFQRSDRFKEKYGISCLYRYAEEGVYCSIGFALSAVTLDEIDENGLNGYGVNNLIERNIITVDDEMSISLIQLIHDYKMGEPLSPLMTFLHTPRDWVSLPQEAVRLINSIGCPNDLTAAKYTAIMRAIAEHPGDI